MCREENMNEEIFGVDDYDFGQNMDVEEIEVENPTLFSLTIDASPSMDSYRKVVPDCIQMVKDSIIDSKAEDEFVVSVNYFNDTVTLGGYQNINDVSTAYDTDGYTALYDAIVLAGNALKTEEKTGYYDEIKSRGGTPKAIFVVLSDGWDNSSTNSVDDAKEVIAYFKKCEIITAFVAFGKEAVGIGEEIGFANVLNVKDANEKEFRRIFRVISKSVQSASKSKKPVADGNFFQV